MKIYQLLITVLVTIALSSCTRENDDQKNILMSKTWKRAKADLNPATNPRGPILYYAVQNCETDDTFIFNEDGTLTINRNNDKCSQNEVQNESQSYSLNRQSKVLIIDGTTYTLAEESNQQIKYYAVVPATNGFQYLIFLLQ